MLQKCINYNTSRFYVHSAYFVRIYLLVFSVKHYYGAQYEIDRMNAANTMDAANPMDAADTMNFTKGVKKALK